MPVYSLPDSTTKLKMQVGKMLFAAAMFSLLATMPSLAQIQRQVPQSLSAIQLSFAPIVRRVTPAVVNVYATTITNQQSSPFASDPFFERFFGGASPFSSNRPRQSKSLGSGVMVDSSGIILTNSHVVSGATDIRIALSDGHEFGVDLLLNDETTDLAVLRIKGAGRRDFPTLEFADSDRLQVGDLVLAVGNPFGVGQTVTSGIISALARTGIDTSDFGFFIQTDAAINPGNSGGALVDMQGRLVGINSAIFTQGGGSVGIGFAIPANMARLIADAGIHGTQVVRPWFGAELQDVTSDIAQSLNIDPPHGAIITGVTAAGPAASAGLRVGDVILTLDDAPIDGVQAFDFRFATKRMGSDVEIGFARNGRQRTASLTLRPEPAGTAVQQVTITGNSKFSGVTATLMTSSIARRLGLRPNASGVVILSVKNGSAAAQFGLRKNDVIVNLNGEDMTDLDRFRDLASSRPRGWQIVIQRGNQVIRSFNSG